MNILEKNLNTLEYYDHIIESINQQEFNYVVHNLADNTVYEYNNNHFLFDAISEEKIVKDIDNKKDCLYIVFGIGNANHLEFIIKLSSKNSRIILIETNKELFLQALNNIDLTNIIQSEKIKIIVAEKNNVLTYIDTIFKSSVIFLINSLKFIEHPYTMYFSKKERVHELQRSILRIARTRLFEMGNDIADTIQGLKQNFENIPEVLSSLGCKDIKDLKIYEGKPAVIVSAGPSLNKQLNLLKKIEKNVLLLCVDTALEVLLENNIEPDAVFSIERIERVYDFFYKKIQIPKDMVLVSPPVIFPEIYKKFSNKIICFKHGESLNHWINELVGDKGMFNMGTSVAHLAFGFAEYINANPIIFIGQDLAYGQNNASHVRGSAYEKEDFENEEEKIVYLDGYYGGKVKSTETWEYFLSWFENAIIKSNCTCINATEGGVKIKGTLQMSFKEAVKNYTTEEKIISLNEITNKIIVNEIKNNNNIILELKNVIKSFRKIKRSSKLIINRLQYFNNQLSNDKQNLKTIVKEIKRHDNFFSMYKQNPLYMIFLQTHVALTYFNLNNLSKILIEENVKQNILIQKELFNYSYLVMNLVIKELEDIIKNLSKVKVK